MCTEHTSRNFGDNLSGTQGINGPSQYGTNSDSDSREQDDEDRNPYNTPHENQDLQTNDDFEKEELSDSGSSHMEQEPFVPAPSPPDDSSVPMLVPEFINCTVLECVLDVYR
jgi:hypothetical protein